MNRTRKLTTMAIFVAIGTIFSIWFPARVLMAYPIQHTINVMVAILLGTKPALAVAFMIGLLRILLGSSSLLALPGGMIGALLAGYFYTKFKKYKWAVVGEIIGTGLIASIISVPFAKLFMGTSYGAFYFFPSFLSSTIIGSLIGWGIVAKIKQTQLFDE